MQPQGAAMTLEQQVANFKKNRSVLFVCYSSYMEEGEADVVIRHVVGKLRDNSSIALGSFIASGPTDYRRVYYNLGHGTSLHWAVRMEDTTMVADILAEDIVDVNSKDKYTWEATALHFAVWIGNVDIVKAMVVKHLESGKLDVNVVDFWGYTALHWAIVRGGKENIDMVRELLKCKDTIRLSEESIDGQTPLQIAHEMGYRDIQKTLMEHEAVRRYVEELYRDRQVYVDAANAILVGAALIASVTFASWLQPPLGYTPDHHVDVQHNTGLRAFWVFNSFSFYFAIATVVSGARSVLPRNPYFIKRTVEKLRKNLLMTAVLLACSVFFVIIAFGIAGCIVLTPILKFQWYMIVPTVIGGLVCLISLVLLSHNMWEDSFGKNSVARKKYEWSEFTTGGYYN